MPSGGITVAVNTVPINGLHSLTASLRVGEAVS